MRIAYPEAPCSVRFNMVAKRASSIALVILAMACGEPATAPIQGDELSATLTDVAFAADSRCEFTLLMNSKDHVHPVRFTWEIDQARSSIPPITDSESRESGSFFGQASHVWEWKRPDNGFALIVHLRYELETDRFKAAGRLVSYCP